MSLLADSEIEYRAKKEGMITPFEKRTAEEGDKKVVSYGLSSYGYDIRIGNRFKIFTNVNTSVIDPKNFDQNSFVDVETDEQVIIPPNSFALGACIEWITMPRDLLAICVGKSTYARCGIVVNVTPIEPEWQGHITIEISNTTPLPAIIYPNEGIAQLVFLSSTKLCDISYLDRNGKYQGQTGVTLPKIAEKSR